ncbi:MAG: biotin--protein ligase, partial [Gammaproteobacteria bacterium]|nr:biotin--protein ligase [Gammaproteobacteria bacterium]
MRARWIDLGQVSPVDLYAACQGLAQAQEARDFTPVVLWGRCDRPHVSLGASQWAEAELDLEACRSLGVEVVQRCLGGGTVLVDPDQWCFFFVLPRVGTPASRDRLFETCLAPAVAAFRELGLAVQRVGRGDLWLDGRKILGSGAATLGQADVLGASFLLRFQAGLFARLVRSPSAEFRIWLEEALAHGMTDWARHGRLPGEAELRAGFQRHISACLDWVFQEDQLAARERDMIAQARVEL